MTDIDWAGLVSAVTGLVVAVTGAVRLWTAHRERDLKAKGIPNELDT